MAASGNSPLKLIQNVMLTFFDAGTLANSSCYGIRQHKGLNRDVTAACINKIHSCKLHIAINLLANLLLLEYVQSMHPGVSRSPLVDAINDKCANTRRKRKGIEYLN